MGHGEARQRQRLFKEAGNQYLGVYIDKRQATVMGWVVLRPILEVFDKETGNEGGGRRRDPRGRKTESRKQLCATLKDISTAVRVRRRKSGRRGEGGGGR